MSDLVDQIFLAIKGAGITLAPLVRHTPLIFSPSLSELCRRPIYLKLENLQYSGAFKYRPALFNIIQSLDEAREFGVVTSSSGNFAAAVALAASQHSVRATIVLRPSASSFKAERIKRFGGEIVYCPDDYLAREAHVQMLARRDGLLILHPHDSLFTIAGDGTVGLEIIRDLPDVGAIFVPASGAGLLAGIAVAVQGLNPAPEVIGAQPKANGTLQLSLQTGVRSSRQGISTVADGLTAAQPGKLGLKVAQELVERVATVSEDSLIRATGLIFEHTGQLIEPAAAAGLAALMEGPRTPSETKTVLVLTGGNIAPRAWADLVSS